jgi:hypothetical protein
MSRWYFAGLLALQAHFAASFLVPLDEQAQRTFGGLLKWAWPWSVGDSGPLGRMTLTGIPMPGFFLAVTTAGLLFMATLAVVRIWVSFEWWRWLAGLGAALSLVLMFLFPGLTKILPMATALAILTAALGYWTPMGER